MGPGASCFGRSQPSRVATFVGSARSRGLSTGGQPVPRAGRGDLEVTVQGCVVFVPFRLDENVLDVIMPVAEHSAGKGGGVCFVSHVSVKPLKGFEGLEAVNPVGGRRRRGARQRTASESELSSRLSSLTGPRAAHRGRLPACSLPHDAGSSPDRPPGSPKQVGGRRRWVRDGGSPCGANPIPSSLPHAGRH